MMKMEILIHKLLHMFEKQVLMLSGFYLKKFIVKVLVKTRDTHFSPQLLLNPILIQVLNIVVDQVFPGTSTIGYDDSRGEGTNDVSDTGNDGGDIENLQQS